MPAPEPEIDTTVPHSARVWNAALGGKDNFQVDRDAVAAYEQIFPDFRLFARASRNFLIRTVRYLARDAGIRQFLDIGAGFPTAHNTHEAAQSIAGDCRVVYVDHDPVAVRHYQSLIRSAPGGAVDYIEADLRDAGTILAAAARTLTHLRTQPVGLIFSDVMGHITDYQEALRVVRALVDAMPPGSYLMLSHASSNDPVQVSAQEIYNNSGALPYILRTREEIAGFFQGLTMVEPGLVTWPNWRPDATTPDGPPSAGYGAVALIA